MAKDNKRIYVRERDHERYKRWAVNNGYLMLEALGKLMDLVEAGSKNNDKRQP